MKFRKKHNEGSEVFTDSLNDILFILLMFFLIVATLANPNVVKVGLPRGTKDTKAKQNIMVSIDKDQNYYIGPSKVDHLMIDTLLLREIENTGRPLLILPQ
ncbi:MAG: biopolymer transporter ExbD [Bacteroidota bacterium]